MLSRDLRRRSTRLFFLLLCMAGGNFLLLRHRHVDDLPNPEGTRRPFCLPPPSRIPARQKKNRNERRLYFSQEEAGPSSHGPRSPRAVAHCLETVYSVEACRAAVSRKNQHCFGCRCVDVFCPVYAWFLSSPRNAKPAKPASVLPPVVVRECCPGDLPRLRPVVSSGHWSLLVIPLHPVCWPVGSFPPFPSYLLPSSFPFDTPPVLPCRYHTQRKIHQPPLLCAACFPSPANSLRPTNLSLSLRKQTKRSLSCLGNRKHTKNKCKQLHHHPRRPKTTLPIY